MNLFGWEITRKTAVPAVQPPSGWDYSFGGPFWGPSWGMWGPSIETFPGAWQRNLDRRPDSILSFYAVYACISLIASDISKIRLRLMEKDSDGVKNEVDVPSFSPVLKKPNHYQNRIKFLEQWIISKLSRGNTYILLERDSRNVVVRMYPLDPGKVKPLVAPDSSVYYDLGGDLLSGVPDGQAFVPASEIIHDVMVPLYHPLCGVSPIYACGFAALQGQQIQNNSTTFFMNGSRPGGVLTAPGKINDPTAKRLKDHWEQNYTGNNAGKIAVLGDGLKYEPMGVNAEDAQLIEQLKWTGEVVCACFHVPPYMVGIAPAPAYNNIEALGQQYYSQCLQALMQSVELCMDEGLGLPKVKDHTYETEFDLDDLIRMDTLTKVETVKNSIGAGFMSPNEGRRKFNLGPVEGGESPYLQQQNYSLAALKRRDSTAPDAAAPPPSSPPPSDGGVEEPSAEETDAQSRTYADQILRHVRSLAT